MNNTNNIETVIERLQDWIKSHEYRGYDPYDGLNSPLLNTVTLGNRNLGRIALQMVKLSPVNLRNLLGIDKGYNCKGMGLLLSSYVNKYRLWARQEDLKEAQQIADWLFQNITSGHSGYCWGYNFDWPNRNFYAKKGTPNLVTTSFVAQALLDLYEVTVNRQYLDAVRSSCDFIVQDLSRTGKEDGSYCFSYTPLDKSCIHNANLLGASLLARTFSKTLDGQLKIQARKAIAYTLASQNEDGSWRYGEATNQDWVDSFHTGYNLLALKDCDEFLGRGIYQKSLRRGLEFYLSSFFLSNGIVKYYNNRLYPLDCHAFSCALITLTAFSDFYPRSLALRDRVLRQAIELFWDEDNGYFYYKKERLYTNKIPYIRWVQAWMFLALTEILNNEKENCLV